MYIEILLFHWIFSWQLHNKKYKIKYSLSKTQNTKNVSGDEGKQKENIVPIDNVTIFVTLLCNRGTHIKYKTSSLPILQNTKCDIKNKYVRVVIPADNCGSDDISLWQSGHVFSMFEQALSWKYATGFILNMLSVRSIFLFCFLRATFSKVIHICVGFCARLRYYWYYFI